MPTAIRRKLSNNCPNGTTLVGVFTGLPCRGGLFESYPGASEYTQEPSCDDSLSPQHHNVPSLAIPAEFTSPSAIERQFSTTTLFQLITASSLVGDDLFIIVPSPTWPIELRPQTLKYCVVCAATTAAFSASMGIFGVVICV